MSIKHHFAVFASIFLYIFGIYPQTEQGKELIRLQNYVAPVLNSHVNLADFRFVNAKQDTIQIPNRVVLIETWNQTCKPCLASLKDLQGVFEADSSFSYFYLYQNLSPNDTLAPQNVFAFEPIQNKENILIDVNKALFQKMNLYAYPFFLVFDVKGNLVGLSGRV